MTGKYKYQELADSLIAEIKAGQRAPGSLLPSVRTLTEEHGQSVALSALRLLVQTGWAQSLPGSGTYVANPLPGATPAAVEERLADHEARLAAIESRLNRDK